MGEQGGAGGVPLEGGGKQDRRRKAHTDRREDEVRSGGEGEVRTGRGGDDGTTSAADTDEASRLDRPQQPEKPSGKGTRWVGPRDE